MDLVFNEVLDRMDKDYSIELLMDVNLDGKKRLEIIYKREAIDEIRNMIKGEVNASK